MNELCGKCQYHNPTNGDIITAKYPHREVIEHDTYIELAWADGMDEFDKKWWNAPCSDKQKKIRIGG